MTDPVDTGTALRMTPRRHAVLAAVRAFGGHPTAEEVYRRVQGEIPGIGLATVYRTLQLLNDHGVVGKVHLQDDQTARYDAEPGRHAHVVCTACGGVEDVEAALPDELLSSVAARSGAAIEGFELEFHGRCAACTV